MATFTRGRPVQTREPFVEVSNRLDPGVHRFRVVVTNADGVQSRPVTLTVEIARRIRERGGDGGATRKVTPRKTRRKVSKKTAAGRTTRKTGKATTKKKRKTGASKATRKTTKRAGSVTKKSGKTTRRKSKRTSSDNGGDGQ